VLRPLGVTAALLARARPAPFVAVHRLSSVPGCGMIVVRPDGYIGMRGRTVQVSELAAWLARVGA
jgi:hypothetical protein